MMKKVTQQDPYGCGVACVASLLKVNYKHARTLFAKPNQAKNFGFLLKEVVYALKKKGLDYEDKYIKQKIKKKIYRPGTIVFIARSKKYPAGHYLLRAEKGWMDPWINFLIEKNYTKAKSGFRKRLPGRAIYAILEK